uniref:ATP-dependent Clp protease proteolytic subunit n=1 Tax=Passiflora tetrandra TaxID=237885 RepID=A0A4Y5QFB7_9ROSI|nr:ATP-dependent Clp protease proteolytic subunit [Passiflora tetrandra]QCX30330.1 ATP-dependent Clp protease proteolytic subunit [Passiflora tetrandra]
MPLGVPKVPFHLPGDDDENWVDLYNRLYKKRMLFLTQEVNSEVANQLASLFIYLNMEESTKDFDLFINSPGGWILPGMTIYNSMTLVDSNVRTICTGLAASMASFILAAGASSKRLAFPHARVMMHQPHGRFSDVVDDDKDDKKDDKKDNKKDDDNHNKDDSARELFVEMEELTAIQENIVKIYAAKTGQPRETILADLERDSFMSATEAQAHGIVDFIGRWES